MYNDLLCYSVSRLRLKLLAGADLGVSYGVFCMMYERFTGETPEGIGMFHRTGSQRDKCLEYQTPQCLGIPAPIRRRLAPKTYLAYISAVPTLHTKARSLVWTGPSPGRRRQWVTATADATRRKTAQNPRRVTQGTDADALREHSLPTEVRF